MVMRREPLRSAAAEPSASACRSILRALTWIPARPASSPLPLANGSAAARAVIFASPATSCPWPVGAAHLR